MRSASHSSRDTTRGVSISFSLPVACGPGTSRRPVPRQRGPAHLPYGRPAPQSTAGSRFSGSGCPAPLPSALPLTPAGTACIVGPSGRRLAMRFTKLGHSCVRLDKDGAVLVIDPGTFSDAAAALNGAAAVLVTHEHPDH